MKKAIYRLNLLKIVDDWTIESWNKGTEILKVYFNDYNEYSIVKDLMNYINRYDKEFSLDVKFINIRYN